MRLQTTWHPQLDNPNFLGWAVVAAYLLAAVSCGWVVLKTDKTAPGGVRIWWLMAFMLLFLGINKQLNLQTLMIIMGRRAAIAGGWYGRRRLVQAVFGVAFALLGLGFLWFFAARVKHFIGKNRFAFAGLVVLMFFVVLRSSTINHGGQWVGIDLKDKDWAWVLELCGSFLIILSATSAAKPAACHDRSKD